MSERKVVSVWTDGACVRNPGPGGFAAVLVHGGHTRELSGGFRTTTNNRMELMAAVAALRALKEPCRVTVHTDARYVVDGVMNDTMRRWRAAGWYRGETVAVANADLWEQLLALCESHEVTFAWVRGHSGDPTNERCDRLAEAAARSADLPPDVGYEEPSFPPPRPTLFDSLPD